MREPGTLAVGSEYAAALYGATIYARDIGDECAHGDGCTVAPGDRLVRRGMEYQRVSRHQSVKTGAKAGAAAAPRRP